MNPARALGLLACLLLALAAAPGCGGVSDGGPVGTGIAASLAGNVVDVETAAGGSLDSAGVEVSIDEVPDAVTHTDDDGNFSLEGEFAGPLTLRFRTGSVDAAQAVDVPAGALVVLSDVSVRGTTVVVEAARQAGFIARVVDVDCEALSLVVEDGRKHPDRFVVTLIPETVLVRRGGAASSCAAIENGSTVAIDGVFRPEEPGRVTALAIIVDARRKPRPAVLEDVPFLGYAAARACLRGNVTIADADQRTRLRFTAATEFTNRDGATLHCADIRLGDKITGVGRLRLSRPGVIEATRVVVDQRARPSAPLRLLGVLVGADCSVPSLLLESDGGIETVRIETRTVIEPALDCDEIPLGSRIRGTGRVSSELPGAIDAIRLTVRPPVAARP